ncbi:hypothetical protein [Leptospira andrefontaineae]|uniref:Uncharacterized protein n=1 Tax=Leptospira andrefontaineae TaxID=2484976 RepID=A0A4R9GXI0_9LEPT|nr:hypothetical protein [Leptospira andrefontaineae]TGK36466.1 hypothetical protein EHO65_16835 [Leptospira andrefontaineae]
MKKFLLPILLLLFFWNCFTAVVMTKHGWDLRDQKGSRPFFQESTRDIRQLSISDKELKIVYDVGLYTSRDSKDRAIIQKTACFSLKSLSVVDTYYKDIKDYTSCEPETSSKFIDLKLEEIPELRNGIWIPDLKIVLYSQNGFDKFTRPFPSPKQFGNTYFYPRINSLKFVKGREVISASLLEGDYFSHRYLRIQFDTKEEIYMYATGSGFQISADIYSWRPFAQLKAKVKSEEQLEIRKFTLPKQEKLISVQYEYPDSNGIFRIENKTFRIIGQVENLRDGIQFISLPNDSRTEKDAAGIWSAYPALYPFSITLDIATSPLQLISILVLGFKNHIYFWGCLLGGRCFSPLG